MCGGLIEAGQCSCGIWKSKEEMQKWALPKAMEEFHDMKQMCLTADSPYLGCAVVFFRGDYKDCEKVKKFIYEMKGRPHYEGNDNVD